MRLTAHFTTEEFDCHDGTPVPRHAHDELHDLCARFLEPLRAIYGPVTVLSGFRTAEHNRRVGGAPSSYHLYELPRWGVAADVRCARGSPALWYRRLDRSGANGLGRYASHVHVDNRRGHARW